MIFISFLVFYCHSQREEVEEEDPQYGSEKYYDLSDYESEFGDYPDIKNETTGELMCGGNATVVDGKCTCLPGFIGNPHYYQQCYKCIQNCSEYGFCKAPGFCECIHGYHGNGTYCYLKVPQIRSMTKVKNSLVIAISFNSDSNLTKGFCKFGENVYEAEVATKLQFICPIPQEIKSRLVFQISQDGENWSPDNLIYEDQSLLDKVESGPNRRVLIIVFAFAMVILILLLANSKPVKREEAAPFIKEIHRNQQKV